MPGQDQFVDQSAGQAGTATTSGVMDALVVAQSSLYVYTTPTLAATLSQAIPAAEVIFNHGDNTALKVAIAASTIGLAASSDNYIDAQPAGAWVLAGSVGVGNAAPALTAGNVRVWKITTGASAPTAVALLAPTQPLGATQVSADATEAATNDTLTAASTLTNNLNRIRYQLAQLGTGAWSSLRAMVQLSPTSQQSGSINVSGAITTAGEVLANLLDTRISTLTHVITAGAAIGTSPNWQGNTTPGTTVLGHGNAGGLYFYTGTGCPATGVVLHVAFSSPLPSANYMVLFTSGSAGGGVNTYIDGKYSYANQTVNGFDIYFGAIASGAAYNVEYFIALMG